MIILYQRKDNAFIKIKELVPYQIKYQKGIVTKETILIVDKIEFTCEQSLIILLTKFTCLPEATENEQGHIEFNGQDAKFITENLFYKNS